MRPWGPCIVDLPALISIHAPVKGATLEARGYGEQLKISIHAPVKGATGAQCRDHQHSHRISIHAPVKGATRECRVVIEGEVISIHAPVKGATGEPGHLFVEAKFQSTHP